MGPNRPRPEQVYVVVLSFSFLYVFTSPQTHLPATTFNSALPRPFVFVGAVFVFLGVVTPSTEGGGHRRWGFNPQHSENTRHRAGVARGTLIGVVVIGPFWFTRENQRVVRTRTQLALACCCTGVGGGDDLRLDASTRTKEKKRCVSLYIRASVPATPDHRLLSPSAWPSGRSAEAASVRE